MAHLRTADVNAEEAVGRLWVQVRVRNRRRLILRLYVATLLIRLGVWIGGFAGVDLSEVD